MLTTPNIILVLSAATSALMAGLFYAYSCSVNRGLGKLPDPEYLAAMQSINRAIQNPLFFISFIGAPICLPLSAYLHYEHPPSIRFWLLLIAAIIYLAGVLGVTVFGNIPLNEALDRFKIPAASPEEITAQRAKFESRWNNLNTIRTIASTLAILLTIIACLADNKNV